MEQAHYFFAIPLASDVKSWLYDCQQKLQDKGLTYKQWVGIDDFHITLKFLGATSDMTKQQLIDEVKQIETPAPFQLKLGNFGWFGLSDKPRVAWIGVEKSLELVQLQQQIDKTTEQYGFKKENRPYRPHITLGKRWLGSEAVKSELESLERQISEPITIEVDRFVLYRIYPNNTPKYQKVSEFKL
ncbi:hypothetical protein GCM10011351_09900 [Paraliobacillus quinghaiensis]|uniref:RNA 2',3'-cyclic phosphodiesterase n=1 Tax=Paraliobacillus quinghaiensis TaxID=470815 RepID=A0A917TKW9_9BACI|nr:RNA 2',3'-cyclic phosphodiesterase [Paraliobacillus quinghaiensis]GGM26278.1 hypothetical protein GCM10011351_09900 [Paraliobacillus quinghaiensis]